MHNPRTQLAMERRRSLPRDHNTSSTLRKSIFSSPFNNIQNDDSTNYSISPDPPNSPHLTPNSFLSNKKSPAEPPRHLHKQRSSDDLQTRLPWPSSKKSNPSADLEIASETYNVSTFSSRQHISYSDQSTDEKQVEKGRKSLRYHIGKLSLKKPGTPPSPSLSGRLSFSGGRKKSGLGVDFPSMELEQREYGGRVSRPESPASDDKEVTKGRKSLRYHSLKKPGTPPILGQSGRFSFNEAALARRRSDIGVDYLSMESEQTENDMRVKKRESTARRPGSPLKGKDGGVGSLISNGFSSLFRRKSFQGSSGETGKKLMVKGVRGVSVAVVDEEMQYKLRLLHNYLIQWRFVNAGTVVVNKIKCDNSESMLVNAWLGMSDLRYMVAKKKRQLEIEKLKFKLSTLVCHQGKALDLWGTMEKQHLAALSSTKDALQAAVCRLPIIDHAKVDPHLLSVSLKQATNVATAINENIAKCPFTAQSIAPLVAELSQVVAKEKLFIEECIELLDVLSTLQVHEESLRSNVIQLKAQKFTE